MSSAQEHLSTVLSVPPDQPGGSFELQDKRLWIGNLDARLSEYNLMKLLLKHGSIEKFDLLFHRSGPLVGHPRGYAFCTYKNTEDAITAKKKLDGQLIGNKHITVRWAHSMSKDELENRTKPEVTIPVLGGGKPANSEKRPKSRQTTIQAIEAKLKLMEHKTKFEDFEVNESPAAMKSKSHVLAQAQSALDTQTSKPSHSRFHNRRHDRNPYQRGHLHR